MLFREVLTQEEINLYNPAYTGFLFLASLRAYCQVNEQGMHCALPYVVLSMALSPRIAASLPTTYRTPIASWVAEQGGELSDFSVMASACIPVVNAATFFLLDRKVIQLTEEAHYLIASDELAKTPSLFNKSESMKQALHAANFIGKWFAHSSTVETIYAQLGIRP
ncbi:three component ABC system middle component [Pseudomonas nitroreducens]|uniref:three component ABC system middle component n=1 Tax=Pseudomonas nitroreducens TaxID=46680 RepID=UPI0037F45B9D